MTAYAFMWLAVMMLLTAATEVVVNGTLDLGVLAAATALFWLAEQTIRRTR